jgi:hypothetical protein
MKKFEIRVPYNEIVYGTLTYVVIADTKEEAEALLERDKDEYYYDSEQQYSEHCEEHWNDAEWEELTS